MSHLQDHTAYSISDTDLEKLMEHLKNHEYRCILKRPQPSDYYCNSGMLVLHMAIVQRNVDLIEYLSDNIGNVNSKNISGDTALLVAMKCNNFEAAKILLDSNADVRVIDKRSGRNALGLLMTKRRRVISDIVPYFVKNMTRNKLQLATLVKIFVNARCSFEYVQLMKDEQLNREFLKRNTSGDLELSMNVAMERRDFEIVQLIMRYGNTSGKSAFYRNLYSLYITNRVELSKTFVERLLDWDVVNEEALVHLDYVFQKANMEYLHMLLEHGIHRKLEEKFKVDLRAAMFGNPKVDAIDLLRKQNFRVDAPSLKQESALHLAVKNKVEKNVTFLLDSGADPNIQDEHGRTALFDCAQRNDINITKILLAYGANVQVTDNNNKTIFETLDKNNSFLPKCLIAQLAIDVLMGVPIKQPISDQILSNRTYQYMYEACFEELSFLNQCIIGPPTVMESMAEYPVSKYVSFFTVLTEKIDKFYRHTHLQDAIALLEQCNNEYNQLHWLYYSTLKMKLIKASNLYRFKCNIADVISKITRKLVDSDHLATRNISECLSDWDIEQFVNAFIM